MPHEYNADRRSRIARTRYKVQPVITELDAADNVVTLVTEHRRTALKLDIDTGEGIIAGRQSFWLAEKQPPKPPPTNHPVQDGSDGGGAAAGSAFAAALERSAVR